VGVFALVISFVFCHFCDNFCIQNSSLQCVIRTVRNKCVSIPSQEALIAEGLDRVHVGKLLELVGYGSRGPLALCPVVTASTPYCCVCSQNEMHCMELTVA
jgi:hypothetical protein